ncbi:MAG: NAD(P)-binding protein [Alphaproteobacteria bacterium]|nr:NAD(P)-binding protein [Alphaproteobacteria bacterium]
MQRVLIVGAGQAGGETAQRLRAGGFTGEITIFGEEPLPPYQRPPLSKKYLAGEWGEDRLLLRPASVYADEGVTLVLNRRVVWIDRTAKRIRLEGGQELPYDALVLATGAKARALPVVGADLPGVHLLRTAAHVEAIRPRFVAGAKAVIIGAGYIGLETAAVARQLGLEVTVIEAAIRPLARVTSPEMAGFFLDQHTAQGVRFALSAQVAVIKGQSQVSAVGMADGSEIPADIVIAGIGVAPETALAELAGLNVNNGVVVDRAMRTSDPDIYAIGDCCSRPLVHYGDRHGRLESVHNAIEGAKIVAAGILGQQPPKEEAPWFWSDQYDLKLQIAGLFGGYDHLVQRGDMAARKVALFYFARDRLIAVDAVNSPAEYLGAKMLIQEGKSASPADLADPSIPMKDIAAKARAH